MKCYAIICIIIFILFCVFLEQKTYAQENSQKLQEKLKTAQTDIERIDILNQLAMSYIYSNPKEGMPYAQEALELSFKQNDKKRIAGTHLNVSEIKSMLNDDDFAMHIEKAILIYEELGDNEGLVRSYIIKGTEKSRRGEYNEALKWLKKSLTIEIMNDKLRAASYNNIGYTYNSLGEEDKALFYLKNAKANYQSGGYISEAAIVTSSIAYSYQELGYCDSAMIEVDKGLKLVQFKPQYIQATSSLIYQKAQIYEEQKLFGEALELYLEALKLNQERADTRGIIITMTNMGHLYNEEKEHLKAKDILLKALKISETSEENHIKLRLLFNLMQVYLDLKEQDALEKTFDKVETLFKDMDSPKEQAMFLCLKAQFDKEQNKAIHAIKKYEEAQQLFEQMQLPYYNINALEKIAEIYLDLNQLTIAQEYIERALAKSDSYSRPELKIASLKIASKIQKQQKNYLKALTYHTQYMELKDSLDAITKDKQLSLMKVKYEVYEEQSKNELKTQEIASLEEKTETDKIIRYVMIGGTILLSMIFAFAIYSQRKLYKQTKQNDLQKAEIQQNKYLMLSESLKRKELEEKQLQEQIRQRDNELTNNALHLLKQNQLIETFAKDLSSLKNTDSSKIATQIKQIERKMKNNTDMQTDWDKFKESFELAHPNFYNTLQEKYPNLTPYEVKLCTLLRMNFNIKELANILYIAPESVAKARYRLRKKLNIEDEHLNTFFINL